MPTELQQRHAKRIEQYAPLGLWFLKFINQVTEVPDDQPVELTLIWARVGKNIKYLRFFYLIGGKGDPEEIDKPYVFEVRGDEVVSYANEITRLMGGYTWNASGMPLFREGVG